MRQHGFTLIELLIALAIATILAMVAVPAFSDFLARQQLTADVNETISVLSFARSEAIKQRQPVTVTFSPPSECHADDVGNNSHRWCYEVENDEGETMRKGQSANITAPEKAFSLTFQSLGDANVGDCSDPCHITISPFQPLGADVPVTLVINSFGSIRRQETAQ